GLAVVLTASQDEPTARGLLVAVAAVNGCEIFRWRQETARSWRSFSIITSTQLQKSVVETPRAASLRQKTTKNQRPCPSTRPPRRIRSGSQSKPGVARA